MTDSFANPLVLVFIFTTIGFVVGAGISAWWFSRDSDSKETNKKEVKQVVVESTPPEPYLEIARVWRNKDTGRISLRMEDKIIQASSALTPMQKEKMKAAYEDLTGWFGGQGVGPELKGVATPALPPVAVPVAVPVKAVPVPIVVDPTEKKKSTGNMVEEVDEILQEIFAQQTEVTTPIRLKPDPKKGVTVWVGATIYDGIDVVPDQKVVSLIRKAVAEWEKRVEERKRV
jgi:hypothetical protein